MNTVMNRMNPGIMAIKTDMNLVIKTKSVVIATQQIAVSLADIKVLPQSEPTAASGTGCRSKSVLNIVIAAR